MQPKEKLVEMLRYMRPEGSLTQELFCARFLQPVMGHPDEHGNYMKVIGQSDIAFMAHHDTVHRQGGMQKIFIKDDVATSDSNCLGADCTTGVWLILEMIAANVPGRYIVHAAEEIGCKGSGAIVKNNPAWLTQVNKAISFDRMGDNSIITHQCGVRTASDAFAKDLESILNMGFVPDPEGVYTDSREYAEDVSECTNISVGYRGQHTHRETQDLQFALKLRDALIKADWRLLGNYRDPNDYDDSFGWWTPGRETLAEDDRMYDLVKEYPSLVAEYLESFGITADELEEELFGFSRSSRGGY